MKITWSWKIILCPAIVGILCFGNGLWIHGKALAFESVDIRTSETGEFVFPRHFNILSDMNDLVTIHHYSLTASHD